MLSRGRFRSPRQAVSLTPTPPRSRLPLTAWAGKAPAPARPAFEWLCRRGGAGAPGEEAGGMWAVPVTGGCPVAPGRGGHSPPPHARGGGQVGGSRSTTGSEVTTPRRRACPLSACAKGAGPAFSGGGGGHIRSAVPGGRRWGLGRARGERGECGRWGSLPCPGPSSGPGGLRVPAIGPSLAGLRAAARPMAGVASAGESPGGARGLC